MGVIIRQGAKSSLVSYIATLLGVVNTIVIYPLTLEIEQLGEVQFVLQTASMLVPFMVLGFTSVSNKFFAKFNDSDNGVQGFFTLLLIPPLISAILMVVLFYFFKEPIFDYYGDSRGVSPLAIKVLLAVTIIMSFASMSYSYTSNLKRIAIPAVLNNAIKLSLPVFCLLFFFEVLTFNQLLYGLVLHYIVVLVVYAYYLRKIGNIRLNMGLIRSLDKDSYRTMLRFAFFGILAGLGSQLATRLDAFMVTSLKTTYDNGIYTVANFMSNTISIPLALVGAISTPMIAGYWYNNEMDKIDEVYKKSSINLFVLGLGVFLVMWAALDGLFDVMPKGDEFKVGKTVVLVLAGAKLVDMVSGLNSQILSMSERYVMYFVFLLVLSFTNVALNVTLIPRLGIEGAAAATLVSIVLFNVLKYLYIKFKFGLDPFTLDTLKVLIVGLILFAIIDYIPLTPWKVVNLILLPGSAALIYIVVILRMGVSDDLNGLYRRGREWLKKWI